MDRTIRTFRITNIALFLSTVVCLVCYDIFGGLWLKGFTSLWFVVLGLTNLYFARVAGIGDRRILRWILLGLIFGMLADILLGLVFLLGVISFALGHLCYLIAFFRLEKPCRRDPVCILPWVIASLVGCFCTPFIRIEDPMMQKFLFVYAVILGTMLGKALSNYLARRSAFRLVLLVGSLLFWFSDLMLGVDMFGFPSRLTWVLCSYCYWPAQAITAHAMYHQVLEASGENR
jgi:uncharacterized membrane protein YhhN